MAWVNIKSKVKDKLESISSIQEVHDYPTEEFNGFPVAVIETVRNESDFETTNENKRSYVFNIYLLQEIETKGVKKAREIIEEVVDDVMEAFDKDQRLSGIELPNNEVMIISLPSLSRIYISEKGKYVVGEVELKVITSFSIS